MLKGLLLATVAMSVAAVLTPKVAHAADPAFCHAYAEAAVNQVRGALANPRCAHRIEGTRWAPEARAHFEWCLTQPPSAAEAERVARTEFLRGCR